MVKKHGTLPFGMAITNILREFGINLDNYRKSDVEEFFNIPPIKMTNIPTKPKK